MDYTETMDVNLTHRVGNLTGIEPAEEVDYSRFDPPMYIYICVTVFYSLIFTFGVLGNILVLVVVYRNRDMRNSTNMFLVNLSLADLMVLLVCMPLALMEFYTKDVWYLGEGMCEYMISFSYIV